jgi:hypothetical protein
MAGRRCSGYMIRPGAAKGDDVCFAACLCFSKIVTKLKTLIARYFRMQEV